MTEVKVSKERQALNGRRPKLNDEQLNALITEYNNGATQQELAERYGVAISTVRRYIRLRKE